MYNKSTVPIIYSIQKLLIALHSLHIASVNPNRRCRRTRSNSLGWWAVVHGIHSMCLNSQSSVASPAHYRTDHRYMYTLTITNTHIKTRIIYTTNLRIYVSRCVCTKDWLFSTTMSGQICYQPSQHDSERGLDPHRHVHVGH